VRSFAMERDTYCRLEFATAGAVIWDKVAMLAAQRNACAFQPPSRARGSGTGDTRTRAGGPADTGLVISAAEISLPR
jgi:hypothetical protein